MVKYREIYGMKNFVLPKAVPTNIIKRASNARPLNLIKNYALTYIPAE